MTVADIVGMTTFGSQPHGSAPQNRDVDVLSPDGRVHAIVVKRGDLARNTNVFSLLLFHSDAVFARPTPDTVLSLASSSNRPAISQVSWLSDNRTLAFLGERPGELPQVYTLDLATRGPNLRTHQATEITSYGIAPSGQVIVYAAMPLADTSGYATMRQRGFVVRPTQFIGDLLQGTWYATSWGTSSRFLVWRSGAAEAVAASVPGPNYRSCEPTSVLVAPSGHLALLQCTRVRTPESWRGYTEPLIAKLLSSGTVLPEFALLDLDRGTVEPLVDGPVLTSWTTVAWAPTGKAVVLANAFLPLDGVNAAERQLRAAHPGAAEVDVRTHRVRVIAHRDSLDVVGWDAATNIVEFVAGAPSRVQPDGPRVRYRKTGSGWTEVRGRRPASQPLLFVEQGLNLPPRLVAVDRSTNRRAIVFDPNPQFAGLRLGREEIVRWRTKAGQPWVGGLYLPPDFASGQRYPLVIQTHGFDSTAFRPDGTHPTANAAQPMAALGMIVLQLHVGDLTTLERDELTPQEAPNAMEAIEAAIDHLDSLGLIDRSRVGLIGFSRTCFHVLYTLTHSNYPMAAAAIADGVDLSYLQYMLFRNAVAGTGSTVDEDSAINGGPPFGQNLETWRVRAPGFNLDRVAAPLRVEAIGLASVLEEWEPYAGLLLQHKPVELFVIPEGAHLLVKPWERLASSQSNVDWFRFWLKEEEDPDPRKAEQYARWRELRRLQR